MRKIKNIYHAFRILGFKRGLRVVKRILFVKKPSDKLQEFIKNFDFEKYDSRN